MKTEELLYYDLFDFQRFARDPSLESIIDEVEERYCIAEMTDDELDMLAAAGDPFSRYGEKDEEDGG